MHFVNLGTQQETARIYRSRQAFPGVPGLPISIVNHALAKIRR